MKETDRQVQIILQGPSILFLKNTENPPISEDTFVIERSDVDGYIRFRSFTSDLFYIRFISGQISLSKDDGSAAFKTESSFLIRLNVGGSPLTIRETNVKLQTI